ncbi:MAG: YfcE family phosphodiesterase [Deltaproteobacteria bacterium]|nr:YfcE family phosphodiesterase [Deltaproteobacteria bacterium]NIS78496.1 YfcE family phosphodiesterase [Deltaproteobacteria bacterium]
MKRFGVISDTHEVRGARVIEAIGDRFAGVDGIIHCGDVVGMDVVETLQEVAPLILVAGNMDTSEIKERFPRKKIVQMGGVRIGVIHGWGTPHGILSKVLHAFRTDGVDAILFGHTHSPMNRYKDGILLFNPGSLLDRDFTSVNSLGILDVGTQVRGHIAEITP